MSDKYFDVLEKCPLCESKNFNKRFSKNSRGFEFTIVGCECGFVFMNPSINEKGLEKIYKDEYYETYIHENNKELDIENKTLMGIIENTTGIKSGKILDVGCAYGYFLESVKNYNKNWQVFGCDISKKCVDYAKDKLNIPVEKCDIERSPYKDGFFDILTMREIIEHVRHPISVLKEINRITRLGGYVVIKTANIDSFIANRKKQEYFYYDAMHVSYFSIKTIKQALKKAGFEDVKIKKANLYEEAVAKSRGLTLKSAAQLAKFKLINNIRLGNFSLTGNMLVIAKKPC